VDPSWPPLIVGLFIAVLVLAVIVSSRQAAKRAKLRPPRHRGKLQSQKGRVYSNAPSHNANPSDGT